MADTTDLLERLAKLEHEQWSSWIKWMVGFGEIHGGMTAKSFWEQRWKLANTPYEKLTETEKEKDREYARKVLAVYAETQRQHKKQLQRIEEELDSVNDTSHPLGTKSWLHEWKTLKKMVKGLEHG